MSLLSLRKKGTLFFINILLLSITFSIFWLPTFNSETIYHALNPLGDTKSFVSSGRYLTYLVTLFCDFVHFNTALSTTITFALALIIYAISNCIVQCTFLKVFGKEKTYFEMLIIVMILQFPLINVFMLEPMIFIELEISYSFAYLCAVLAFYFMTKSKFVYSIVFAEFSVMFYQSHILIAFILFGGYLFILNHGHFNLKSLKKIVYSGGIIIIAGVTNIFSTIVLQRIGVSASVSKSIQFTQGLKEKIVNIFNATMDAYKNNYSLLPNWTTPILIIGISIFLMIIFMIRQRKYHEAIYFLIQSGLLLIIPFSWGMLQGNVYLPPRVIFTLYTSVSMIFLISYTYISSIFYKRLITMVYALFLTIQIVMCNIIGAEHITSNSLDLEYINLILQKIDEYEQNSGNQVEKISVFRDSNCLQKYPQIKYQVFCINQRAVYDAWADVSFLNLISNRKYVKTKTDITEDIYNNYFAGKDWDTFDADEQLIFRDDCLYWIIY